MTHGNSIDNNVTHRSTPSRTRNSSLRKENKCSLVVKSNNISESSNKITNNNASGNNDNKNIKQRNNRNFDDRTYQNYKREVARTETKCWPVFIILVLPVIFLIVMMSSLSLPQADALPPVIRIGK